MIASTPSTPREGRRYSAANLRWGGLKGRTLSTWASPPSMDIRHRRCLDDDVRSTVEYTAEELDLNLVEAVHEATRPLYHAFEFLEMPFETVRSQVARLRSGG